MIMEAGIITSDALCIFLAFLSIGQFLGDESIQKYIFIGGGALLAGFGLSSFLQHRSKLKKMREVIRGKRSNPFVLYAKGFLYNMLNPSVIIFWLGAVSIASADYEGRRSLMSLHFGSTLATVFFFDVVKAWFAHKVSGLIKPRNLILVSRILGIIFILSGLALVVRGIFFE